LRFHRAITTRLTASALLLAAVGHWSCTLVPCDIRRLGGLGVVVA